MEVFKPYTIDLSAQMAVCDANYIRILQLLPEIELGVRREFTFNSATGPSTAASPTTAGEPEMSLGTVIEVIERFRYTSTVKISQRLKPRYEHYQSPEMLIRMYHDAKTAEVISYQQHRYIKARYPLPNRHMYQADEKEQLNFFLAEWLTVCRQEGLCMETLLAENILACLQGG